MPDCQSPYPMLGPPKHMELNPGPSSEIKFKDLNLKHDTSNLLEEKVGHRLECMASSPGTKTQQLTNWTTGT